MAAVSVLRDVAITATRKVAERRREHAVAVRAATQSDEPEPSNKLTQARARLQAEATRAGLIDEDPLGPVVSALSDMLGTVGDITGEHARRLEALLTGARDLAQTEIDRAKAEIAAAEAVTIGRISSAIAASADAALVKRVRVFDRNTALIAAGVLIASIGIALGGGYLWGRIVARAEIVQTEQNLTAAFRAGAGGAGAWLTLMTANDPTLALAECRGPASWIDKATGRRACRVPLWLDAVPPTVPNEAR
jgi:hypothetical protein